MLEQSNNNQNVIIILKIKKEKKKPLALNNQVHFTNQSGSQLDKITKSDRNQ